MFRRITPLLTIGTRQKASKTTLPSRVGLTKVPAAAVPPSYGIPPLLLCLKEKGVPVWTPHCDNIRFLMMQWTDRGHDAVITDVESGERLTIGSFDVDLKSKYGPWFQEHFPLARGSVFITPRLLGANAFKLHVFTNDGTDLKASSAVEGANWFPELFRMIVSTEHLAARAGSKVTPTTTTEVAALVNALKPDDWKDLIAKGVFKFPSGAAPVRAASRVPADAVPSHQNATKGALAPIEQVSSVLAPIVSGPKSSPRLRFLTACPSHDASGVPKLVETFNPSATVPSASLVRSPTQAESPLPKEECLIICLPSSAVEAALHESCKVHVLSSRTLIIRLWDLEAALHTAQLGFPPTRVGTQLNIDRSCSFRVNGVSSILAMSASKLTTQEWRGILRSASTLQTLKEGDFVDTESNDTRSGLKHLVTANRAHIKPQPQLQLTQYLDALYCSENRNKLEHEAALALLPHAVDEAMLALDVVTSSPQSVFLSRKNSPFDPKNAVSKVSWRCWRSKHKCLPSIDATVGTAQLLTGNESSIVVSEGELCDPGIFAIPSEVRKVIAIGNDIKSQLLHLRSGALVTKMVRKSNARLWCVSFAHHILCGYREQSAKSTEELFAIYVPELQNQQLPRALMLQLIYMRQILIALDGRLVISIRERMEGLLASLEMEINGICIADDSAVGDTLAAVERSNMSAESKMAAYLTSVMPGHLLRNFNWNAPNNVALLVLGGSLSSLSPKKHFHGNTTIPAHRSEPHKVSRPLLHRYLLELFPDIALKSRNGIDAPSLPEESNPPTMQLLSAALVTLAAKTIFVGIRVRQRDDGFLTSASIFVPTSLSPNALTGVECNARFYYNRCRKLEVRPALVPIISASALKCSVKLSERSGFWEVVSVGDYKEAVSQSPELQALAKNARDATLPQDALDSGKADVKPRVKKSSKGLIRDPNDTFASRMATIPTNVVFVVESEDPVEKAARQCIESSIAQTVCAALGIDNEECVSFVSSKAVAVPVQESSAHDFSRDFDTLEDMSNISAKAVWIDEVFAAEEFGATVDLAAQKVVMLRRICESMVAQWSPKSTHPFPNFGAIPSFPVKWLQNSIAIDTYKHQFLDGFLWSAIAHLSESQKIEIVGQCKKIFPNEDYPSVGLDQLEQLSSILTPYGVDASLLNTIAEQRRLARLKNIFQPDRLLRCGVKTNDGGRTVSLVHTEFLHQGTNTGRLATQAPTVQNIPKDRIVRSLLTSRFGTEGVMMEADYSQLEVVVLALLSRDSQMIQELRNSVDFHCIRVGLMLREPYETVVQRVKVDKDPKYIQLRQMAKVFSFQRQYGAGMQSIAQTSGLTMQEVYALVAAEEAHYPQLARYYQLVQACINLGKGQLGEIRRKSLPSPYSLHPFHTIEPSAYFPACTGSRFDFEKDKSLPKQKNHPVQGLAGEIVQTMCGRVVRLLFEKYSGAPVRLVNTVHDCIWLDCHTTIADCVAHDVKEVLESVAPLLFSLYDGRSSDSHDSHGEAIQLFDASIPFPVTVHRGRSLGEVS